MSTFSYPKNIPSITRYNVFECDAKRLETDAEYKEFVTRDIERGAYYIVLPEGVSVKSYEAERLDYNTNVLRVYLPLDAAR